MSFVSGARGDWTQYAILITASNIIVAIYKMIALCIIFSIIQYLAMIWYGLSYIPYARNIVKSCCKTTVTNVV
jgi:hypothetical protein